jgi:hypothetical protein
MQTIETIRAEEATRQAEFEAKTVAAKVGGHDYTIAELRKVFDAVANEGDWKAAWAAAVPHQMVGLVIAAVEWFHADRAAVNGIEALTGRVLMSGKGYQA